MWLPPNPSESGDAEGRFFQGDLLEHEQSFLLPALESGLLQGEMVRRGETENSAVLNHLPPLSGHHTLAKQMHLEQRAGLSLSLCPGPANGMPQGLPGDRLWGHLASLASEL